MNRNLARYRPVSEYMSAPTHLDPALLDEYACLPSESDSESDEASATSELVTSGVNATKNEFADSTTVISLLNTLETSTSAGDQTCSTKADLDGWQPNHTVTNLNSSDVTETTQEPPRVDVNAWLTTLHIYNTGTEPAKETEEEEVRKSHMHTAYPNPTRAPKNSRNPASPTDDSDEDDGWTEWYARYTKEIRRTEKERKSTVVDQYNRGYADGAAASNPANQARPANPDPVPAANEWWGETPPVAMSTRTGALFNATTESSPVADGLSSTPSYFKNEYLRNNRQDQFGAPTSVQYRAESELSPSKLASLRASLVGSQIAPVSLPWNDVGFATNPTAMRTNAAPHPSPSNLATLRTSIVGPQSTPGPWDNLGFATNPTTFGSSAQYPIQGWAPQKLAAPRMDWASNQHYDTRPASSYNDLRPYLHATYPSNAVLDYASLSRNENPPGTEYRCRIWRKSVAFEPGLETVRYLQGQY
ncbi:hypothetical protein C8R47DRAFT_1067793 [Mycena vitilis]|nr:hypothetical protein C8R47DRAFT_1067793 [Mycena vitilis]